MSVFNLDNNGDNDPIGIVQSSPASNTALTVDDYDQAGAINNAIEGATRASSFVNNTYIDFTLNNTGKGWISKIGISKFALRMARDLDNTIPFLLLVHTEKFKLLKPQAQPKTLN